MGLRRWSLPSSRRLFFLLLAGIVEFGQAFRVQHMLSTASRQGARLAIVSSSTSSQVQQKVETLCVKTLGVSEEDITVEITVNGNVGAELSEAVQGDEIQVAVQVPYSKAGVGFFAYMFSDTILSANCIFERE